LGEYGNPRRPFTGVEGAPPGLNISDQYLFPQKKNATRLRERGGGCYAMR